ncbi:MAG TPA: signal peptidase I [Blastocatellia bacterium]|jgi:signal peptidase I
MTVSHSEIFLDLSAELLGQGYRVRFRPKGGSMHPTIKDGEAVNIEPVEPADVRRGDIILYKSGISRGVIAHRVLGVNKSEGKVTSFVLRGDASRTSDPPVEPAQVLGRVVSVEREGSTNDLASKRAKALWVARRCASRVKTFIRN